MTDGPRSHPLLVAGIDALRPEHGRLYVAIGVFDGLHIGHLYLLRHLRQAAASHEARAAVITFDHHPDEVLLGSAPPLLCDPMERLSLLANAGVDVTVVQHFDRALQQTGYDEFVRHLASKVDLAGFLMTPDAAFGYRRQGTPVTVAALGARMGFEVMVVPPMELGGRQVRSAEIRADIAAGNLAGAEGLLGRPYAVIGEWIPMTDGQGIVRFAMPVALPPVGEYPAIVGPAVDDAPSELPTRVSVLSDGTLRLATGGVGSRTAPVRVTFTGREGLRPEAG